MLDVDLPAFYVAHVRHLQKLIHEGHSGFLLIENESSSLFSNPFQDAHKASLIEAQHLSHRMLIVLQMQTPHHLPELSFFQQSCPLASYSKLAKTIKGVLNQTQLTHWYRLASPQRHELARLR